MSARGESLHTNQVTPHSGGYLCHMKQLGIVLFCLDGISRNEEFCIRTNWPTRPAVIFAVCSRKRPGIFLPSPPSPPPFAHLDGTPLHPRVNPEVNLPGPIYTLGWRETLKTLRVNCLAEDTAQCPRSGLEKE